jgi:hypothetical protein
MKHEQGPAKKEIHEVHEQIPVDSPETTSTAKKERLHKSPERESKAAEESRRIIEKEARSNNESAKDAKEDNTRPNYITKEDKAHSFNSVMSHARQDLSKPERALSKFMHQPAVEKVSDIAGKTIARPSGAIGAAVFASAGIFIVYLLAKRIGFTLSGSEAPILVAVGFITGLLVEWAYKAIRSLLQTKPKT